MRKEHREVDGWEQTLEQYIKALQDHDYMEKRSKSARDPFLATGEYNIDNYVLNCNIDDELVQMIETQQWSLKRWEEKNEKAEPICGTRGSNVSKMWQLGFRRRVAVAAMGGAFLLGPMWLMVLKKGLYISLISTTAFVTGFGLIMAYFLDQEKDVLASTAAYAAVLVVFIGTGTSG
ncbi:hypothetical protein F5884DRAFT_686198 [Xylogone sp. PMI_703]|nr:hypothetical protein F5884DRAFT_686198 [Xylogone sp. PMI_703]